MKKIFLFAVMVLFSANVFGQDSYAKLKENGMAPSYEDSMKALTDWKKISNSLTAKTDEDFKTLCNGLSYLGIITQKSFYEHFLQEAPVWIDAINDYRTANGMETLETPEWVKNFSKVAEKRVNYLAEIELMRYAEEKAAEDAEMRELFE